MFDERDDELDVSTGGFWEVTLRAYIRDTSERRWKERRYGQTLDSQSPDSIRRRLASLNWDEGEVGVMSLDRDLG